MEDERTGSEDADASGAEVTGIVGDANGGAEGGAAGVAERGAQPQTKAQLLKRAYLLTRAQRLTKMQPAVLKDSSKGAQ